LNKHSKQTCYLKTACPFEPELIFQVALHLKDREYGVFQYVNIHLSGLCRPERRKKVCHFEPFGWVMCVGGEKSHEYLGTCQGDFSVVLPSKGQKNALLTIVHL